MGLFGNRTTTTTKWLAAAALTLIANGEPAQGQPVQLPDIYVTSTRTGSAGITGASTTVITAEEIERSPSHSLQDILSREPGIQVQNLFGGVNGARSTVDMRGFGAAAANNTLVLINGRRITDLDLVGVDLASIPRESIERIEITRGNSGVVLYGDGAVGGTINIITKNAAGQPPKARIDGAFGSFNYREGNASVSGSNGPWSASVIGNAIGSNGYRVNNEYRQYNGVGDFRYTVDQGSIYLNLSADDQNIGLPGHRRVQPNIGMNKLVSDRRGAFTPYDFAGKEGQNATLGFTRMLAPGAELIVDGGIRRKQERAQYYNATETAAQTTARAAVETDLSTVSFTPRLKLESSLFGIPWKATGGFDYYNADYDSRRPLILSGPPIHHFDLGQTSRAFYWQQTFALLPSTDFSVGGRVQQTAVAARDTFNVNAPGASSWDVAGNPLNKSETNRAWHLGLEHRFNDSLAVFGRMAQSFRVPNVDERVGAVEALSGTPTTFDLRTQRSHDIEGGVRLRYGAVDLQWSMYDMRLTDEIHFRYGPSFVTNNTNLDPTRRFGNETVLNYRLSEQIRIKGGFAYTRAVFREGVFAGNDVPLVSRWTGNAGVSWDIWQKYLVLDTVVRYVGTRRMDNDQTNLQPKAPAHTLVDMRIGGEIEKFFWSFAVQNVFDAQYFDYAIASPYPYGFQSTLGTYNAYPQPGRTFMARAGMTW